MTVTTEQTRVLMGATANAGQARRLTGWCGLGMVAAIVINGPMSMALGRVPSYWAANADQTFSDYLSDASNVRGMVVWFVLSNLIFVFGIGFFAGLRALAKELDSSGWLPGVVSIGAALFLAGGLLSEVFSHGIAVVLRTTPAYHLDVNTALLLQGLWSISLAQGQVALGAVVVAYSYAARRSSIQPTWLSWLGLVAGTVAVLRPAVISNIPAFIATFQPTFVWIAATAVVHLRMSRTGSSSR